MDNGVTINRPPRDGYMAFIKSPDGISIELLQKNKPLEIIEPWNNMKNIGTIGEISCGLNKLLESLKSKFGTSENAKKLIDLFDQDIGRWDSSL